MGLTAIVLPFQRGGLTLSVFQAACWLERALLQWGLASPVTEGANRSLGGHVLRWVTQSFLFQGLCSEWVGQSGCGLAGLLPQVTQGRQTLSTFGSFFTFGEGNIRLYSGMIDPYAIQLFINKYLMNTFSG